MATDPERATTPDAEADSAAATPSEAAGDELAALRRQLDEQRQLADSYYRNWQRAQADLANFRRRAEAERDEQARRLAEELIHGILPTLDDFERAFLSLPPELLRLTWLGGVALIERRLRYALETHGLTEIVSAAGPFDPTQHEAVLREEVEVEREGHVLAVLQRGYRYGDRVVRPALVKVGVARAAAAGAEATPDSGDDEATGETARAGTGA